MDDAIFKILMKMEDFGLMILPVCSHVPHLYTISCEDSSIPNLEASNMNWKVKVPDDIQAF